MLRKKLPFLCNLYFNSLALELSAQFTVHKTLDLNGDPLLCMFFADDLVILDFLSITLYRSYKMTEIKKIIIDKNIDVIIINEANVTKENIKFYNLNSYTIYALYKSVQIASGILASVKTTLTTKFHITKEMNEGGTSEIVGVTVWVEKTQFKIYDVYSLPNIFNTINSG
jgi:hypothetical protein